MKGVLNCPLCTATTYHPMIKMKCNPFLSIKSHQTIQMTNISKSLYFNNKLQTQNSMIWLAKLEKESLSLFLCIHYPPYFPPTLYYIPDSVSN